MKIDVASTVAAQPSAVKPRTMQNTLINILGRFAVTPMSLLLTAFMVRKLGQNQYGLLMLCRGLAGNTTILENLFGTGTSRYVTYYESAGDTENRQKVIDTSLAVSIVQAALVALVLSAIVILFFEPLCAAKVSIEYKGLIKPLFYIFLVSFLAQIAYSTMSRTLEGLQDFKALRTIDVSYNLLLLCSMVVYLQYFSKTSLLVVALIYLGMEMVRWLFAYRALVSRGVQMHLDFSKCDKKTFWSLFNFGKPLVLAKVGTLLTYRAHVVLIGIFLTLSTVSQYQVAAQIQGIVVNCLGLLTSALFPAIVYKSVQNPSLVRDLFIKTSKYMLSVAFCAAVFIYSVRSIVLHAWVGPGFELAGYLLVLFMIQNVVANHQGIGGMILVGLNRHQALGKIQIVSSIINVIFTLSFISRMGASALIGGMILDSAITAGSYLYLTLKALDLNFVNFLWHSLIPSWFSGLFSFFIAVLFSRGSDSQTSSVTAVQWLNMVLMGTGISLLIWFFVIEKKDRKRLMDLFAITDGEISILSMGFLKRR